MERGEEENETTFIAIRNEMRITLDRLKATEQRLVALEECICRKEKDSSRGVTTCPFCGRYDLEICNIKNTCYVYCRVCGARAPGRRSNSMAWDVWNKRASDD